MYTLQRSTEEVGCALGSVLLELVQQSHFLSGKAKIILLIVACEPLRRWWLGKRAERGGCLWEC